MAVRTTGEIKRIVQDKGYGFIRDSTGKEYFFHHSALRNVKFDEISNNDKVEFDATENSKGRRAEDIHVTFAGVGV